MRTFFLLLFVFLLSACKVNQLTGKKTFNAFSNKQLFPMAFNQYSNFLKEHTVLENTPEQREIVGIGEQIARAAQAYYEFKGAPEYLKDYAWEYNLVKDPQKNAW
jgi:hypothetical protein